MGKKKIDLPPVEWHPTKEERKEWKYPGVYYLISSARHPTGKEERIYYVRYRTPDGKQHFERAGRDVNSPAKAAQVRADKMRGKVKTNVEKRTEERAKREAERTAQEAEAARWTLDRLWQDWKADPENQGKDANGTDENRYAKHLKGPLGDKEPKDILEVDLDRLRHSLAKSHSKETTSSVFRLFKRIVRYGFRKHRCPGLSFEYSLRDKKLGREPKRRDVPTDAEMDRWLKTAENWPDPQVGNLVLLAFYNGIRRSSLLKLKWEDLREAGEGYGVAHLRDTKAGMDMTVILIPEAKQLLDNHPKVGKSPYVFSHPEGRAWKKDEIAKRVRELRNAAGLPGTFEPLHTFRRNVATMLTARGASKKSIQEVGGWQSDRMVDHYTKTHQPTLRADAALMSRKPREGNGA